MLDIGIIIKIGIVGIVMIVLDRVLESGNKKEFVVLTNLAGIIIILILVVSLVSKLFNAVQTLFYF